MEFCKSARSDCADLARQSGIRNTGDRTITNTDFPCSALFIQSSMKKCRIFHASELSGVFFYAIMNMYLQSSECRGNRSCISDI